MMKTVTSFLLVMIALTALGCAYPPSRHDDTLWNQGWNEGSYSGGTWKQ